MTESIVLIRDRQEVTAEDLSGMGAFARLGVDNVVADGITDERRYVGLTVAGESSTSVRVAVGRLYDAGAVYAHDAETVLSMTAAQVGLPVVNKKLVAIYAYGQAVETNSEARDFLVNPDTDEAEPNVVTTRNRRICYMGAKAGTESVDPILPALPDNSCLVAIVTISPTGVDSILMALPTKLDSVESVAMRTTSLETFRNDAEPTVGALVTEFSSLNERTMSKASAADLEALRQLLQGIQAQLDLPATYSEKFVDYFDDDDLIDTSLSSGTYKIGEDGGLMFPDGDAVSGALALFNPYDPGVYKTATNFIIPKHTDVVTVECPGYTGEQSITEFAATTLVSKQLIGTRSEVRYGTTPGTKYSEQVISGYENRITGMVSGPHGAYLATEKVPIYKTVYHTTPGKDYSYTVQVPYTYYKEEATTTNFTGSMVGQTFITKRAGWGKALGLFFTKIAAAGDVHVFIVAQTNGKPDPAKVVSKVTVARNDLKAYPEETKVILPPHILESGERVGFIVQSEGAHSLARGEASFTEGGFFFGDSGKFFQGDENKDIKFRFYQASFDKVRTEVVLESSSLAGGITDLFISTEQPALPGTSLTFEVQVAGIWYPFTQLGALATVPNLIPLRVVMLGTSDMQPGLQLGAGRINAYRPSLSQTVVSEAIELVGADKQNWLVDLTTTGWISGQAQELDVSLLHGAGYATETAASTVTETELSNGKTRFRFAVDCGAAVGAVKVKIVAARTTPDVPFRVLERTAIAVS